MASRPVHALALFALLAGCAAAPQSPAQEPLTQPSLPDLGASLILPEPSDILGTTEPTIAVRPGSGGATIVVAATGMHSRPNNLKDLGDSQVIKRSLDGGAQWTASILPESVLARFDPLGEFSSGPDPVLAYAPNGRLFLAATAIAYATVVPPGGGAPVRTQRDQTVFVTYSDDDGATWSPAVFWRRGTGTFVPSSSTGFTTGIGAHQDRPWLDVGTDGTVHLAWIRWAEPTLNALYYTQSTDGGKTWASETAIGRPPRGAFFHATHLVAAPDGRTYLMVAQIPETALPGHPMYNLAGGSQRLWRTTPDGQRWEGPYNAGPASWKRWGALAADPEAPGELFVAGIEDGGRERAYTSQSKDAGLTWSAPALFETAPGVRHMNAFVHAAGHGRHIVAFYELTANETLLSVHAFRNGTSTFAAHPLDGAGTPTARIADYFGIDGDAQRTWLVWASCTYRGGVGHAGTCTKVAPLTWLE